MSSDDLRQLIVAFCNQIKAIEGIEDTFDPCTTISITPLPPVDNGGGVSAVRGSDVQPVTRVSAAAVVGLALAALFLLMAVVFAARRKQREKFINKHHSLDDYDDSTYLKDDYDRSSYKSDLEGAASRSTIPAPFATPPRQTHILGEADSLISSWDGFTPTRPVQSDLPLARSQRDLQVEAGISEPHAGQDVHKCSSATCEICEADRQAGLQFIPAGMPSHSYDREIPSNSSSREYISKDTVDL
jgi:hypothetical protein